MKVDGTAVSYEEIDSTKTAEIKVTFPPTPDDYKNVYDQWQASYQQFGTGQQARTSINLPLSRSDVTVSGLSRGGYEVDVKAIGPAGEESSTFKKLVGKKRILCAPWHRRSREAYCEKTP